MVRLGVPAPRRTLRLPIVSKLHEQSQAGNENRGDDQN